MSREVVIPTVEETLALQAARIRHLESLEHGIEPFTAHLNNPCARVYRSTDQLIPDAAVTAISFSHERFDTDNIWVIGSPTRLTCRTAGKYQQTGSARFDVDAVGVRWLAIRLNGLYLAQVRQNAPAGVGQAGDINITTLYELAVGEYVEFLVYQNSGGALNVEVSSAHSPEFMMARVG